MNCARAATLVPIGVWGHNEFVRRSGPLGDRPLEPRGDDRRLLAALGVLLTGLLGFVLVLSACGGGDTPAAGPGIVLQVVNGTPSGPGEVTLDVVEAYQKIGVNRLVVGPDSADGDEPDRFIEAFHRDVLGR